jgi:ADP-ribose pyrophosphatase YjhB (NUDIX family)
MSFVLRPPKMKKWTRSNTTRVADYPVFGVEKHDIHDGEGRPRRGVYTFACTDWCNVIARTPAREIVMIWQYRFGTDELSLEIPGGVIDKGEAPLAASKRELLEETGYGARAFTHLSSVAANPAIQSNWCHTFFAEDAVPQGKTSFDDLEECELALVPEREIARLIDNATITHALVVSALETWLRRKNDPTL